MTIKKTAPLLMSAGLAGLLSMSTPGHATELKVIASGALKGAMATLQPDYEKASGNTLTISWGPSMGESPEAIPMRIRNNEPMDLAVMADETLDTLSSTGAFNLSTRREVALSPIGAGVPSGHPHPDISTPEALKAALLNAKHVAYSQGASGVFIRTELFKRLGIESQMQGHTIVIEGKELVGTALARGDADFGMQQVSELKVTPGVDFLGPLPDALQKVSKFCAVSAAHTPNAQAAQQFIDYLTSAHARQLLEKSGLQPVIASNQQ